MTPPRWRVARGGRRRTSTWGRRGGVGRSGPGVSAVLVGLVAAVVAAALPVSALLFAGSWATAEVTARIMAGSGATATAVGGQTVQAYGDAVAVFGAAASQPSLLRRTGRRPGPRAPPRVSPGSSLTPSPPRPAPPPAQAGLWG